MRKHVLSACFLCSFIIGAFGQSKQEKELIKNIDKLIAENYTSNAPGCVVMVAKNDHIIYNKAYGKANIELDVALRPEMAFRIGSITKQFTAVAILQLIEQGKILLQDSIQKFIKDFPVKSGTITIENLLTHTSGLIDYEVLDFHIPNAIRIDFPTKQLIDSFSVLPLEFTPASRYGYSNSNYLLLGYIIEKVSGKCYKDYLQEHIFSPAGLTNTTYDSPTGIISNRVSGYSKDSINYWNAGYISMSQVFSAGALVSTVEDLYKWHQALFTFKLLKKETLEKAITRFQLADGSSSEYGYGFFISDLNGYKSVGHGGAIDGFRSMQVYLPDQQFFIAALANSDNNDLFKIFETLADLAVVKLLPAIQKDLKLPDSILSAYVGTYVFLEEKYVKDSIIIYKEGNGLKCNLSNRTGMYMDLVAQSPTLFRIPVIKRVPTNIEFIVEGGKVKGAYWTQQEKHELRKL